MKSSFIQKEFNKNWNKLAYTDIKYEHIICINNDPSKSKINNKFYRKIDISGNNLILREIVKDIEDVKGDLVQQCETIPLVFGINRAKKFVYIIAFILILIIGNKSI